MLFYSSISFAADDTDAAAAATGADDDAAVAGTASRLQRQMSYIVPRTVILPPAMSCTSPTDGWSCWTPARRTSNGGARASLSLQPECDGSDDYEMVIRR